MPSTESRSQAATPAPVLKTIAAYLNQHPLSSYAIQLGDWFDMWRVYGADPNDMTYVSIENAAVYHSILDLDAQIGLPHVIGNHDAGFLRSLSGRRSSQPALFRLGFWIGRNVYAMHGHQTEPPESDITTSTMRKLSVSAQR